MNIQVFLMSHQINGMGYYSKINIYATLFLNLLMKLVGKHRLTGRRKLPCTASKAVIGKVYKSSWTKYSAPVPDFLRPSSLGTLISSLLASFRQAKLQESEENLKALIQHQKLFHQHGPAPIITRTLLTSGERVFVKALSKHWLYIFPVMLLVKSYVYLLLKPKTISGTDS